VPAVNHLERGSAPNPGDAPRLTDVAKKRDGGCPEEDCVLFPDLRQSALNGQRGDLPYEGCDIYKIHLQTRQYHFNRAACMR
jgi:hypothetical protein